MTVIATLNGIRGKFSEAVWASGIPHAKGWRPLSEETGPKAIPKEVVAMAEQRKNTLEAEKGPEPGKEGAGAGDATAAKGEEGNIDTETPSAASEKSPGQPEHPADDDITGAKAAAEAKPTTENQEGKDDAKAGAASASTAKPQADKPKPKSKPRPKPKKAPPKP